MNLKKCEQIFQKICKHDKLHEAVLLVENSSGSFSWKQEYKKDIDTPITLASITKLFVTACVLQMEEERKLTLEDKISKYLDKEIMTGLHIYKGVDYSDTLTIRHLLCQTSGLPDYFFYKTKNGESYQQRYWNNREVTFEEMVHDGKAMDTIFAPGKKGRAFYSDFNFDLLGKILENIEGKPLYEIYEQRICLPLGLINTYALSEKHPNSPVNYHKGKPFYPNNYLRSFPASGGVVSTTRELMIFLKAFFSGKLFEKMLLEKIKEHNRLQVLYGSIRYSGGHMYIHAGYLFDKYHTFRGHSGASGTIAYYCEETDLFFVGDLNNGNVYRPVNMMIRLEVNCR